MHNEKRKYKFLCVSDIEILRNMEETRNAFMKEPSGERQGKGDSDESSRMEWNVIEWHQMEWHQME